MIIRALNLANFRAFAQLDMRFDKTVNVIAGVNGVGKSSLLRAAATVLSRVMPEVTASTIAPHSLTDEDVSIGKSTATVLLSLDLDGHQISASLQRLLAHRPERERLARELMEMRGEKRRIAEPTKRQQKLEQLKLKRSLEGLRSALSESGDDFHFQIKDLRLPKGTTPTEESVQRAAADVTRFARAQANQPFAVFYSTRRMLAARVRKLPAIKPLSLEAAYPRALDDADVELSDLMLWFRLLQRSKNKRAHEVRELLRQAVRKFAPEFTDLRVEEEPNVRFAVQKAGKTFALHQLSDGERGLLAMVLDIARRLAIANPRRANPLEDGKAVVLIDEIELHLHPQWQRTVLRRLNETFKGCQFIVTTHSPQVLGEVKHETVHVLESETASGRIIAWQPERTFGLDANRLLEEVMDVPALNRRIKDEIHALSQLIDEEKYKKAVQGIDALERKLGDNHPEVLRLRSLIAFLTPDK